jgi:hypothetical protein
MNQPEWTKHEGTVRALDEEPMVESGVSAVLLRA